VCGGPVPGSPSDQPAKDQKPTMIVVRSVLPPDLKEPKERRSFVLKYGLTQKDFDRCKLLDGIKHLAPLRHFPQEVRRLEKTSDARLVATTESYAKVNRFEMAAGRFLKDNEDQPEKGDDERSGNAIVLGAGVAKKLFPLEEPVGKTVVLNRHSFKVIGVIQERMPQKVAGQTEDFDKDVYIPFATARAHYGETVHIRRPRERYGEQVELHQIVITVANPERLRPLTEAIRELLKKHHEKQDWDVTVR
jgi:putative ABC transport system permease protein